MNLDWDEGSDFRGMARGRAWRVDELVGVLAIAFVPLVGALVRVLRCLNWG